MEKAVIAIIVMVLMTMITNQTPIPTIRHYLQNFGRSAISQHNHQYNVNTAQQDNTGHTPKSV